MTLDALIETLTILRGAVGGDALVVRSVDAGWDAAPQADMASAPNVVKVARFPLRYAMGELLVLDPSDPHPAGAVVSPAILL